MEKVFYAAYRGDTFIFVGTAAEVAKKLGVPEATAKWYAP